MASNRSGEGERLLRQAAVRRRVAPLFVRVVIVAGAASSGCNASPSGTIQLVTGGEADALTRSPAVTRLEVQAVDASGHATTLATASLPASSIDLGGQSESTVAALRVTGSDAMRQRVVSGASLP